MNISVQELKNLHNIKIIDIRPSSAYNMGHIMNAVNISYNSLVISPNKFLNKNDTYIGKAKSDGATIEKFADTPDCCFIDNTDIKNKPVPNYLDKEWYVNLAKKRLSNKFGMNTSNDVLF